MSEIEKQQARREALDAVGSRPPTGADSRTQQAMRQYLGSSVWAVLHRHNVPSSPAHDEPEQRTSDRQS